MNQTAGHRSIPDAYRNADQRIIFLDYDGTLVPFHDLPEESTLSEEVHLILSGFAEDVKNSLYIISGRDRNFLTEQFTGLHAGLIAEHGYFLKEAGGEWNTTTSVDIGWKRTIGPRCIDFSLSFPGSFIEEKESSVAYHFRGAGTDAERKIRLLFRRQFRILLREFPALELLDGDKVIEIKQGNYDKGLIASQILAKRHFDFIMAAGDDLTDERLFARLPPGAFTIKIGDSPTQARFRISTQNEFIAFLRQLPEIKS